MSSEKTANLSMHKWLTTDYVKMAEFNENFKKIDDQAGEIKEAKTDIDGVVQAGLPERLTADFGKVTSQLADTLTFSDKHGVVGDRAVDESTFIQSAIDAAIAAKVKKLVFPKKTYRIETPMYFRDEIKVDFNGSTFEWYGEGTINLNAWGEIGMFNVRGELDATYTDTSIIAYIRSLAGAHTPPATAPTLLTLEPVNDYMVNATFMTGSKFTTSNNAHFAVGDDVLLMGWTRATYAPYDGALFEPELRQVVKVTKIDANYIYTDYCPPFNYPAFVNNATVKSVAMKVNMVENVQLYNLNIKDMVSRPLGTGATTTDKLDTPSGVVELLASKTTINNYRMDNHRFNALYCLYSQGSSHKKIEAHNAQWWNGGEGYCIQMIGCHNMYSEVVFGDACRHTIDVSWSNNIHTKKATGINPHESDFAHHGCTEHDIYWENCHGTMAFNSGIQYFPEIVKNVFVKNSNLKLMASVSGVGYVENLVVEKSRIQMYGFHGFNKVKYLNSEIDVLFTPSATPTTKRDTNTETTIVFEDCDVHIKTIGDTRKILGFYDYDYVTLNNVRFDMTDDVLALYPDNPQLVFSNFKLATVDNVKYNTMTFLIRQTKYTSCEFNLLNSKADFISKNNGILVQLGTVSNTTVSINISRNLVDYVRTIASAYLKLYNIDAGTTNSNILVNMNDNKFLGNESGTIYYTNAPGTGSTVYIQDYKNVIKNKHASATFNADNVLI